MVEPLAGRMPNVMFWCLLLFMAPQLASAAHAESEAGAEMDWFGVMLCPFFKLCAHFEHSFPGWTL